MCLGMRLFLEKWKEQNMAGVHTLVKKEEHQGNLPGYQHYRECSCGWQCRLGSEQTADSQFAGHQLNHGYAELSKEEQNEPKNTQEQEARSRQVNQVGVIQQEEKKQDGGNGGSKIRLPGQPPQQAPSQ